VILARDKKTSKATTLVYWEAETKLYVESGSRQKVQVNDFSNAQKQRARPKPCPLS